LNHELDPDTVLAMLPDCGDRQAYKAYILRDWNKEVSKEDMETKNLRLQLGKVVFCPPESFLKEENADHGKVIYQRLFQWTPDLLKKAWEKENLQIKLNIRNPRPLKPNNADKETKTSEDTLEIVDEPILDLTEEEWTQIFNHLPYRLLLLPYHSYSFKTTKLQPVPIAPMDQLFLQVVDSKYRKDGFNFAIEWQNDYYEGDGCAKSLFNKVLLLLFFFSIMCLFVLVAKHRSYEDFEQHLKTKKKSGVLTLYDCIDAWCAEEKLTKSDTWFCNKCNKHMEAMKKLDIWSFPEILIVHLKRFQVLNRSGRGEKISALVDFPVRGLDLSKYVIDTELQSKPIYDLYAVSVKNFFFFGLVCHSGGLGGGHYTAYALNSKTDRWYYFNDSTVKPAKISEIVDSSAYVLFYKKCH
ncbi:ubiquitin specific peptidase 4 (proto-oncogene), partial [Reticulomyxa filosa]